MENFIEFLQNLLYQTQIKSQIISSNKIEDKPLILSLKYLHFENYDKNKKVSVLFLI